MRFALLAVLLLPIVEIAIFIKVGQTIGLLPTLGLILAAALLGGLLLRQQGVAVLMRLRRPLSGGEMPARTLFDAMLLGLAAVLLLLPGFMSDIVAIALLLPPVRGAIYGQLASRVVARTMRRPTGAQGFDPRVRGPGTIDLDDQDYRPR